MDEDEDHYDRWLSIADLVSIESKLPTIITFNERLDKLLGGGIHLQKITEIYGDKGCGKTSLCCQLAIDVQIPSSLGVGGLGSECLFIDTENTFVLNRVESIAKSCVEHCRSLNSSSRLTVTSLLQGIHYLRCSSVEELQHIVQGLKSYIQANRKVKLVVIDSLAFLFYNPRATGRFEDLRQILYKLFEVLFQVAVEETIAIVVTNNLTTRFTQSGSDYRVPFLGEAWPHIPNIRIELQCARIRSVLTRTASVVKGRGQATKSDDKAVFTITSAGIRE